MVFLTDGEATRQEAQRKALGEGLEQGKLAAKLESIPRLLALGLTVEQIAQALDLNLEQVQEAAQK